MKAYVVTDKHETSGVMCFVRARDRNHAKAQALGADDSGFLADVGYLDLRATRVPGYDTSLTVVDLVRGGDMWTECAGCACKIASLTEVVRDREQYPEEAESGPAFVEDGVLWCCQHCHDRHGKRLRVIGGQITAMCLYADY